MNALYAFGALVCMFAIPFTACIGYLLSAPLEAGVVMALCLVLCIAFINLLTKE